MVCSCVFDEESKPLVDEGRCRLIRVLSSLCMSVTFSGGELPKESGLTRAGGGRRGGGICHVSEPLCTL